MAFFALSYHSRIKNTHTGILGVGVTIHDDKDMKQGRTRSWIVCEKAVNRQCRSSGMQDDGKEATPHFPGIRRVALR